ncbi:MAG: hypothetical protein QGG50_07610, partial [Methanopyri archaeon]|nr:hypothetical protein [Methanopyri archaeon]
SCECALDCGGDNQCLAGVVRALGVVNPSSAEAEACGVKLDCAKQCLDSEGPSPVPTPIDETSCQNDDDCSDLKCINPMCDSSGQCVCVDIQKPPKPPADDYCGTCIWYCVYEDGLPEEQCKKDCVDHCDTGSQDPCASMFCGDDNDPCTEDFCEDGVCKHEKITTGDCGEPQDLCAGKDCGDGNPCTLDACDPDTGGCDNSPKPAGTACDDGDGCTEHDACREGLCRSGDLRTCDDKDPCTEDFCASPGGECKHEKITTGDCGPSTQPFCGDGTCDDNEDCSCEKDCGCPEGEHCEGGECKSDSGPSSNFEQKCPDQECDQYEKENGMCCQDCGCGDGKTCDENTGFCKPTDDSKSNLGS